MANSIGLLFRVTTWGETRGKGGIGCVIDGCPSNLTLSETDIQSELDRRRPGQSDVTTPRKELDKVTILSGIYEGKTTGAPIALHIANTSEVEKGQDPEYDMYQGYKTVPRPGHCDYMYSEKFKHWDPQHGGRGSGRETAARVAAGAIAKKILKRIGVEIVAFSTEIAGVPRKMSADIDNSNVNLLRKIIESNSVRTTDTESAKIMREAILVARDAGDSVGGIVEVVALNIPVGLGEPVFDKLNSDIGKAILSIPAVAAIGIGDGFKIAKMRGSEYVDDLVLKDGEVRPVGNKAGGIKGGISNGNPIKFEFAVKPTSSISLSKNSVNLKTLNAEPVCVYGQHDPCIVPRIVPVAEAMLALVLVDHSLRCGCIPRVFE